MPYVVDRLIISEPFCQETRRSRDLSSSRHYVIMPRPWNPVRAARRKRARMSTEQSPERREATYCPRRFKTSTTSISAIQVATPPLALNIPLTTELDRLTHLLNMVLLAPNGFLDNPFKTRKDVETGLVSRESSVCGCAGDENVVDR